MTKDELMHFGVKGMRWGRRRTRGQKAAHTRKKNAKKQARIAKKAAWEKKHNPYGYSKKARVTANVIKAVSTHEIMKIMSPRYRQTSYITGQVVKKYANRALAKMNLY